MHVSENPASALAAEMQKIRGCLASKKTATAGRRYGQEHDQDMLIPGMDPFLLDAQKISNSKAARRMLDKTQVMTNAMCLHIRRRITHCHEVASIAATIADILGLNVWLAQAIGMGHDIGHVPFGHDGERFMASITNRQFSHEVMGVVIAQHVERNGKGLNLTREVLRSFLRQSCTDEDCGGFQLPQEGYAVAYADRIAYLTGDYNDIHRIGYEVPSELRRLVEGLGSNQRERVNTLIAALCRESAGKGHISFKESETAQTFLKIKKMMYEIYAILNASNTNQVLGKIYEFLKDRMQPAVGIDPALLLALMTDMDVIFLAGRPVLDYSAFQQTTVNELVPNLRGREIKWWDPDMCW